MKKNIFEKISIYSMLSSLALTSYIMLIKFIVDGLAYKATLFQGLLTLGICTVSYILACYILDIKKDLHL